MLAVEDLSPTVVGRGRALVAAALAATLPAWRRERLPERRDLPRLPATGLGVVIGFPLFSSLALRELTSAHASVIVGLLPVATAVFAVTEGGERPGRGSWAAAFAGLAAVVVFAGTQGATGLALADLYVLVAVALAGCRRARMRGSASPTSRCSRCSWACSPDTAASRSAASRG